MKDEIRVLGIDDGPSTERQEDVLIVGTVLRGGSHVEGVLSTHVERDGDDATVRIADMVEHCKFRSQLQAVFLDGIAVAGFNVINLYVLNERTGLPVITVSRDRPDQDDMVDALETLQMPRKADLIRDAPTPEEMHGVFVQAVGTDATEQLLEICCSHSNVPEAVRLSHLIAGGIVAGESSGGA